MLFIMRGATCSGKDRFIDQHFGHRAHVLSSDFFREMLIGDITAQHQNKRVFELMHSILEERFINRVNWTVLNATHLRIKDLSIPIELCKKYQVPFTILSIEPPSLQELHHRNHVRSTYSPLKIPDEVLEKHHHRYFASKDPFLNEAKYNPLCTWIELDQEYGVLDHVH